MEDLAPPLELLLVVKHRVECGEHLRSGINAYIHESRQDFRHVVRRWLVSFESQGSASEVVASVESHHRRALLQLLERGLQGLPIHSQLLELEEELVLAAEDELQQKLASLPLKMLLPLLFFIFPSYMILLLAPLLRGFL